VRRLSGSDARCAAGGSSLPLLLGGGSNRIVRSSLIMGSLLAVLQGGGLSVSADDWPQWRGPLRDGVWRETGIADRFEGGQLPIRWRVAIKPGYAGPAVAEGRVFVTDRDRDKHTERVLCLDVGTGQLLWRHEYACTYGVSYDSGPRATPTVRDAKVYTLGAMGHLFCLDACDGRILWTKDCVKDYRAPVPVWGFASAPLVDGERLIALIGGADTAAVVVFHKDTGREIWRSLSAREIGYCPPVIIEAGGTRQLIVWMPEELCSLDPHSGEVHWRQPFHCESGLSIATPITDGHRLFVSTFYNGPLMLRLAATRSAATVLWKGESDSELDTEKVHCLMSTPWLKDGYLYAVGGYGALRCLDAETGARVWETYQPTGNDRWWNAFLIPCGDRVFIANEQGELITARLSPKGYEELSRARLIEPTNRVRRRDVVWSHPAFANRHVFARNDKAIVCASLETAASQPGR